MMRLFQKRPRTKADLAPTPAQLKAAEQIMYATVCQSHAVVMTTDPSSHPVLVTTDPEDRRESVRGSFADLDRHESVRGALADLATTPVEEFLTNFRENGSECMCTAYLLQHPIDRSAISGALFTTLPEDVFALVEAHASLLDDFLQSTELMGTEAGDSVLADAILSILRNLWHRQTHFRNTFLKDWEYCIAAANDFLRMAEKLDELMQSLAEHYPHLVWTEDNKGDTTTCVVRREASDLISLFSSDAVHASQRAVTFIMQSIQTSDIPSELFSHEWEDRLVHNEVALSMVKTFEDYLSDVYNYLDQDFLYHKVVIALVRSTVCFYVQCFVNKADQMRRAMKRDFGHKREKEIAFMSTSRAICRMTYDIEVLRDYFYSVAKESALLGRVVANELSILVVLLECTCLAVNQTGVENLEEFVVVVHKRTGADLEVTQHFLSDLWLLMGPKNEHHAVEKAVKMMHTELQLVSARLKEKDSTLPASNDITGLRLDEMLKTLYEDRILHQKSSVCGNILRDVKELREERKLDASGHRKPGWKAKLNNPLKRFLGQSSEHAGIAM